MQGPVFDIVLLLFLILFFGLHQRRRPQGYFRFWVAGWLLVICSYAVWEVPLTHGPSFLLQKAIRYDLIVCAGLAFAMSFLVTPERQRQTIILAILIAVPTCVGIDLQELKVMRPLYTQVMIICLAVVGHALAILVTYLELPKTWIRRRAVVSTFYGVFGVYVVVRTLLEPGWPVITAIQVELFSVAAFFYATIFGLRSVDGFVGTLGFTIWALFYQINEMLEKIRPDTLTAFYSFWDMPKYFVGFAMILRIFEESAAEKARLTEEYRTLYQDFHILYENHPEPMWIGIAETGQFAAANQAAIDRYGFKREEMLRLSRKDLEQPFADKESLSKILPISSGGRLGRLRCKDGQQVWVDIHERPIMFDGVEAFLLGARDLTDLVQFNSAMAHQMAHDELTGLPNRRLLEDRMEIALARCVRDNYKMAVLSIDIDHFKQINDTHGHPMGDACLKAVTERLNAKIRKVDTLARVGGEEFVALIGDLHHAAEAQQIAQNLLQLFAEPLPVSQRELAVTVSIGVAVFPDDGYDSETLYTRSDEALYAAKQAGRNRCVRAGTLFADRPASPRI